MRRGRDNEPVRKERRPIPRSQKPGAKLLSKTGGPREPKQDHYYEVQGQAQEERVKRSS